MYVKFVDESTIENAPKFLMDEENTYANPLPETLEEFGYKTLVETECPNEDGYTYTFEYRETEEDITKVWIAHEIVIEPEPEVIEEPELEESGEPVENTEEELDNDIYDDDDEYLLEETPAENVQPDTETHPENVQEEQNVEE